tara:strand:- start:950 stop:1084 length:135 start_codon:yes stop_codon:yes gene_type:complete
MGNITKYDLWRFLGNAIVVVVTTFILIACICLVAYGLGDLGEKL